MVIWLLGPRTPNLMALLYTVVSPFEGEGGGAGHAGGGGASHAGGGAGHPGGGAGHAGLASIGWGIILKEDVFFSGFA